MRSERGGGRRFAPQRVDGVDISALPLTPVEAFVLSQLDGATELSEVALVTNLDDTELARTVTRLEQLGALSTGASPHASRVSKKRFVGLRREEDEGAIPSEEQVFRHLERAPKPKSARPAEPECDLDEERRLLIDELHSRIESLSHYQLLGVEPVAAKKEIRNAYFSVIATFHPDRYFGKRLGNYKQKIELVFERLTRAYEVLGRVASREEYDRYLGTRRLTRSLDAVLSSIPPPPPSRPPAAVGVSDPEPDIARNTMPAETRSPSSGGVERRQRLARRLAASEPAQSVDSTSGHEHALESLRQMVAPRRAAARAAQVDKFRRAGVESLEEKHYVSAVNAFRIACSIAPEDDELRAELESTERLAAKELAENYSARAKYEESHDKFADAARSYERLASARPDDPKPLERASACLLKAGTDPRQAVTLARRAVGLAPKVVANRLTLARAYEAAALTNSAIGELQRAHELAPGDAEISEMLRRLRTAKRDE
jgi:curved DNA-binding protein CbpA